MMIIMMKRKRWYAKIHSMLTPSIVNIFRVTGPLCGEFTGHRRGALMFSLTCAWINGWVNNREAGDLRRHCTHYGVTIMNFRSLAAVPVIHRQISVILNQIVWSLTDHTGGNRLITGICFNIKAIFHDAGVSVVIMFTRFSHPHNRNSYIGNPVSFHKTASFY